MICTQCPRLVSHLGKLRVLEPDWHNAPVEALGDVKARLLVVGLAPGRTGANRTGFPFTGDPSGDWLWSALHSTGFSSGEEARGAAPPKLIGAAITNAVKCVPPGNRPDASEIANCAAHFRAELATFAEVRVVVALGRVAHDAIVRAFSLDRAELAFAHGAAHRLDETRILVDSFHPSPHNTRTGRLTRAMWTRVWDRIARLVRDPNPSPWAFYVLRCEDGSLYTGISNDVAARFAAHARGRGARYTRWRGAAELVWTEPAPTKSAALIREAQIKKLPRAKKLALINQR